MRNCYLAIGCLVALAASPTPAQTVAPETPQFRKLITLSKAIAVDLERRDGSLTNAGIFAYVQSLADRMAVAANVKPLEVHLTRGQEAYAVPLSNGALYISATLFERLENEAELAGLLAHELAHSLMPPLTQLATIPIYRPACVLGSNASPFGLNVDHREAELAATRTGLQTLRTAGYEPTALLDLFSKLSYNNPAWAKAIVGDDLLDLRVVEEAADPPTAGYIIDSSAFDEQHFQVLKAMGHAPRRATSSLMRSAAPIVR